MDKLTPINNDQTKSTELRTKSLTAIIINDRPKNLSELIKTPSITFGSLKRECGEKIFAVGLLVEIQKMLDVIGCQLSDGQIKYLMNDILMTDFPHYSFGDLKLLQKRLMSVKTYGAMKIQNIIDELHQYDQERTQMAMMRHDSIDKETESRLGTDIPKDVLKSLYDKIDDVKRKKKVIEITDESRKRNQQNIETIKLMYPKNTDNGQKK